MYQQIAVLQLLAMSVLVLCQNVGSWPVQLLSYQNLDLWDWCSCTHAKVMCTCVTLISPSATIRFPENPTPCSSIPFPLTTTQKERIKGRITVKCIIQCGFSTVFSWNIINTILPSLQFHNRNFEVSCNFTLTVVYSILSFFSCDQKQFLNLFLWFHVFACKHNNENSTW